MEARDIRRVRRNPLRPPRHVHHRRDQSKFPMQSRGVDGAAGSSGRPSVSAPAEPCDVPAGPRRPNGPLFREGGDSPLDERGAEGHGASLGRPHELLSGDCRDSPPVERGAGVAQASVPEAAEVPPAAHTEPPATGRLTGPLPALPRLRRLFDPRRGWFRRIEREVNILLSAHIYPRIPGIDRPYEVLLERHLTVSEATIELGGLHRGFDGARVLLITDIHVGPFLSIRALRRTFERLLTLEPDVILLGGDLTTSRISEILPQLEVF